MQVSYLVEAAGGIHMSAKLLLSPIQHGRERRDDMLILNLLSLRASLVSRLCLPVSPRIDV